MLMKNSFKFSERRNSSLNIFLHFSMKTLSLNVKYLINFIKINENYSSNICLTYETCKLKIV